MKLIHELKIFILINNSFPLDREISNGYFNLNK